MFFVLFSEVAHGHSSVNIASQDRIVTRVGNPKKFAACTLPLDSCFQQFANFVILKGYNAEIYALLRTLPEFTYYN